MMKLLNEGRLPAHVDPTDIMEAAGVEEPASVPVDPISDEKSKEPQALSSPPQVMAGMHQARKKTRKKNPKKGYAGHLDQDDSDSSISLPSLGDDEEKDEEPDDRYRSSSEDDCQPATEQRGAGDLH